MSAPPVRLLADDSADSALREALEQARSVEVPFDAASGLERLRLAIASEVPAPPPAGPEAAGATTPALGIVGALGAVAGVSLLLWALSRSDAPPPAPSTPPPTSAPVEAPSNRAAPATAEPALPIASGSPVREPTVGPAAAPSASSARATLAEEVRHLGQVRRLSASDPARAAQMADEGHAKFRRGMLYQEREAVAIGALARAGRGGEARSRATRFLTTFPKSPYADQVRGAMGVSQ